MIRESGRRRTASAVAAHVAAILAAAAGPSAAGAGTQAVVLTTVENMYSAPDAGKDVVSQALLGQVVGVLERSDGFVRIQTPDRYTGWVASRALFTYPDVEAPRYAARGPLAEVTSLLANLYRDPDVTTARPKAHAPMGARLEVLKPAEDPARRWVLVRLPSGEGAYVQSGDVELTEAGQPRRRGSGEDLVATARRFTGVPYLWGGMSALGLDCSGLTSQVYALNGISLRRDAHMQFEDGRPVDRTDLRPGDLVFFGEKRITHVGIHAGDGRFINATTHTRPDVHEESLDDPHWAKLFRGARRFE
ncbi:MAG TPA: C40 family peptidase [Vicinamibacteria bacterium]|nr:C40 family peptidase [Vicinamibacteria bacterium]